MEAAGANVVPDISGILSKIGQTTDNETKEQEGQNTRSKKGKVVTAVKGNQKQRVDEDIPRGRPKSGRIWKTQKERFATVKKTVRGKTTAKHLAYREEIAHIKQLSRSIKDERKQENEDKRKRREENKQRRLENERKAEIVQIIKNPAKLKRLRKKQLRMVEKRDLSKIKVV